MQKVGKKWQVGLPPFHEKSLLLWAYCKRQSKTGLSQNIIQARVEANLKDIEMMVKDQATDWGCSIEEAKVKILEIMKYDATAAEVDSSEDDD